MTDEQTPAAVTADPATLADLHIKLDELGGHKLAEYAFTLGLYPPDYQAGQPESISEYWPPGTNPSEPCTLVWDSTFMAQTEEDDKDNDSPDPWGSALPPS